MLILRMHETLKLSTVSLYICKYNGRWRCIPHEQLRWRFYNLGWPLHVSFSAFLCFSDGLCMFRRLHKFPSSAGLHYINHSTSTLFFFKSFFYFYIFALSESLPSISMAASVDPLVVGRVIGDVVDMFIPKVTMSVYFGPKHVTNGCDIKPSTAINPPKITITGHADELYTLVCFLHHACVFFLWKLRLSMCYIWFISKQARLTCICICRFWLTLMLLAQVSQACENGFTGQIYVYIY